MHLELYKCSNVPFQLLYYLFVVRFADLIFCSFWNSHLIVVWNMLHFFIEGDNATVLDIIAQTSWDRKSLDELVKKFDSDPNNEKVLLWIEDKSVKIS